MDLLGTSLYSLCWPPTPTSRHPSYLKKTKTKILFDDRAHIPGFQCLHRWLGLSISRQISVAIIAGDVQNGHHEDATLGRLHTTALAPLDKVGVMKILSNQSNNSKPRALCQNIFTSLGMTTDPVPYKLSCISLMCHCHHSLFRNPRRVCLLFGMATRDDRERLQDLQMPSQWFTEFSPSMVH